MAIESSDDVLSYFHPDDFGKIMTLKSLDGNTEFYGDVTSGHALQSLAGDLDASLMTTAVFAPASLIPNVKIDDMIEFEDGKQVRIVDVRYKGPIVILPYHESW